MSGNQVTALQDGASALKGLAVLLPFLALGMLALAVYLSTGRRRHILMVVGVDLFAAGVVVLIARNLIGNSVVDSLVKTDAVKPAGERRGHRTRMLQQVGQATIIAAIPIVFAAWLAGPARPAAAFRRKTAPATRCITARAGLRDRHSAGRADHRLGPVPATRLVVPVLIMVGLLFLGVEVLRRQTIAGSPRAAVAGAPLASRRPATTRPRAASGWSG